MLHFYQYLKAKLKNKIEQQIDIEFLVKFV